MNTIILNGETLKVESNLTILAAAKGKGISIPTLCYSDKTGCGGRCMVCAVKINGSSFQPACTTICQNDMQIDTESEDVVEFRKQALELLLSEHIGDCQAPCQLVCPQNINIPGFLSAIINGGNITDFEFNPHVCQDCGGKCEKACRRARLDQAVAIRRLLQNLAKTCDKPYQNQRYKNQYQHHIGLVEPDELKAMIIDIAGNKHLADDQQQAVRCLECDCLRADNCQLRNLGTSFKARQQKFKAKRPRLTPPIVENKIIFAPDKCIRCCRCVELGKKLKPTDGPIMAGRGQKAVVSAPFNMSLAEAFAGYEEEFVNECPTGALCLPKNKF